MRNLADQLVNYANYHRDRRNILTHFVGIPLIVAAAAILLSSPHWLLAGWTLSPATLVALLCSLYYLRLSLGLGLVMTVLLGLALWAGQAAVQAGLWLPLGIGLFVVGWVFQFIGHYFEGKKPAFLDDLMGLAIGPLFVVAELAFLLGLLPGLKAEVEGRAGPVH
ncbi:DUF962 domain-containing protein [Gallaecimonas kandeliae]|uniref:Mpo1 family 2-hydroxy fatty acid dioxygenase n=1 Tax=Gallaecimonas kandeliae TaxID=3029055 RepID=UPI00264969C7|nr:Mpo1-like protein [Gallaecimonas kandeliae]WKE66512.1 DUF962 domain-containing protein [Gallaecimonas kandeliae]